MTKAREVNHFKLQNFSGGKCNRNVKELITESKNGFSFEVKKNEELNLLSEIKKKFEDFSCGITFHEFLYQTKGIIYIQNCEFTEEFEKKNAVPIHRKRT